MQILSIFPIEEFCLSLNQEACAITKFAVGGADSRNSSSYQVIFKYIDPTAKMATQSV